MARKRTFKRIILFLLLLSVVYAAYYAWFSFPIISGYSAKNACSCAFIQGRSKETINKEELGSFPLSIGSISINYKDSSVTGTVLGVAKRKAIFRSGLGCTLVNDISEKDLRSQGFSVPFFTPAADTLTRLTNTLSINSKPVDLAKLDTTVSFAFSHSFKDKDPYTRAVVVVHNGAVVAEKYANGYNENSKFLGWSMAKSITGALVGILVRQGKLNVHQPAPVAEWKNANDKRHNISLENLLQQTTGLDFTENYNGYSNVTNMLFNKGDMAAYTASLSLKDEPGAQFYYSSGNSNLLSRVIRTTVGEKQYHSFPYDSLFHKIGMYKTMLEPDASGTFVGSSYVYATARDYARFGLLYLNDGVWNSERILPEGWVRRSTISSAANKLKNYGFQFWLNGLDPKDASKSEYPEVPSDMFLADGYGGQRIYIIPSLQLVVVRMGLNMFDEHRFLSLLVDAMRK